MTHVIDGQERDRIRRHGEALKALSRARAEVTRLNFELTASRLPEATQLALIVSQQADLVRLTADQTELMNLCDYAREILGSARGGAARRWVERYYAFRRVVIEARAALGGGQ